MPIPLRCPYEDWESQPTDLVAMQVAAMLLHLENSHGDGLPQPIRESIQACAKELEKVPV